MENRQSTWSWMRTAAIFAIATFVLGFSTACSQYGTAGSASAPVSEDGAGQNSSNNNNGNGGTQGYHALYNSVTKVEVKLKSVYVRTDSGRVIEIPTTETMLDLKALGSTQGVKVKLPGAAGSGQETVVEIILKLKDSSSNLVTFDDGRTCKLKTSHTLTLFTRNPLVLDNGIPYLVHAAFDPLESLYIDCKGGTSSLRTTEISIATGDHHDDDDNCGSGQTGCHLSCRLACTRLEVTGVEFDASEGGNF
ncbi:MAG TPA: hypothetical protein VFV50_14420 [Bdellovibrionales bacterium]|nr:hypothetical protein [Bdellovibrionales bacterium]